MVFWKTGHDYEIKLPSLPFPPEMLVLFLREEYVVNDDRVILRSVQGHG